MRRNINKTKLNQRNPGKSTYELEIARRKIDEQSECRKKYQNE